MADQPAAFAALKDPLISVVIPVYNTEKYIAKCLDSVRTSSIKELEIICVDDGSTDSSLAIMRAYKAKDPRIKVITQENQYAGAARNAGIRAARGKYIHFLDADDEIFSYTYERLYALAEQYEADVSMCLYYRVSAENEHELSTDWYTFPGAGTPISIDSAADKAIPLFWEPVVPWNKLYRRDFLLENNIFFDDLIAAEDRSFYFHIILKAKKIIQTSERLILYRVNINTSQTGSGLRFSRFDVEFRSFENIWKLYQDASEELKVLVLESCVTDSLAFYNEAKNTEYKSSIQKQLHDYWENYMPLFGAELLNKAWYPNYLGACLASHPEEYSSVIHILYRLYNKINTSKIRGKRYFRQGARTLLNLALTVRQKRRNRRKNH